MPKKGYRSITLPEPVYNMIVEVRKELLKKGLDQIPKKVWDVVESDKCPRCGSAMERIEYEVDYRRSQRPIVKGVYYFRCPKCGMAKPIVSLEKIGSLKVSTVAELLLILGTLYLFESCSR